MLPGKKYTPEDVVQILRKRIWMILVPWAIIAAVTAGMARRLPDLYESTALIQVVPPKVQSNIAGASQVPWDRRLQSLQTTILSRTKLERLIQEFDLYKAEREKSVLMEEIVQSMRDDIHAQPVKGDAFMIRYTGRNPSTVMKVTERLAGYFKDENQRDSNDRAAGSNSFVESQVEAAKRKLEETEDKLTQYKLRHSGELPTQLAANMQAIQSINQNLNSIAQNLSAANTNKTMLERMIAAAEGQGDPANAPTPVADPGAPGGTAAQRLAAAKAQLSSLQMRGLLPTHADYIYWQGQVAALTKEAEAEALQNPVGLGGGLSPAERARQAQLVGWRDDLERIKKDITVYQAEEKRQRALAQGYQTKIDSVPTREAELVVLTRDYQTLSNIYQGYVAQREASTASMNLESRQMGEQFNLIEPARLPGRPSSPNRFMINLMGLAGGLAVGLALVVLFEYRDTTFKTDSDLSSVTGLPVLAVVPVMKSEAERRAEFRKQLFVNAGLGSTVFLCLAVLTYSFVFAR